MNLDLDDVETCALLSLLIETIEADRYPMSPRIRLLRQILAKFGPMAPPPPARAAAGGPTADTRGAQSGTSAAISIGTPRSGRRVGHRSLAGRGRASPVGGRGVTHSGRRSRPADG